MFAAKLLANSVVTNNCYIALNMFEHVFTFHISHTTWQTFQPDLFKKPGKKFKNESC